MNACQRKGTLRPIGLILGVSLVLWSQSTHLKAQDASPSISRGVPNDNGNGNGNDDPPDPPKTPKGKKNKKAKHPGNSPGDPIPIDTDPKHHPEVDENMKGAKIPSLPIPPIAIPLVQKAEYRPIPNVKTPKVGGMDVANTKLADPQTMKLLVIGIDGNEPGYGALTAFLDQIGIPYDSFLSVCRLNSSPCAMPVFNTSGTDANYYGIVMTIGNLAYCNSAGLCQSTFSTADWAAMDSFTAAFGVRTLSLYTFPQPRYGLVYASAASPTTTSPVNATIPSGGTSIFLNLVSTANIPIANAYTYFATTTAATGEVTTPVLQAVQNGVTYTLGAYHKAASGQEYLALTMDNNPFLQHSLTFNYGLLSWVTKGIFLGAKKAYLSPQVDDFFIPDDLFDATVPACSPGTFLVDPTVDLSDSCDTIRIAGGALNRLQSWQAGLNGKAQTANFRVSLAFNGLGADPNGDQPDNDTLVPRATALAKYFYWMSHTYNHINLDCYNAVPNSGVCPEATDAQSDLEISQNITIGNNIGLGTAFDKQSMVTPEVSGLPNPAFMSRAYTDGVKFLVSDASKTGQKPPSANTGIPNALNPKVLEIPRFATNIFYNADDAATDTSGSEVDEYNHFYGPNGVSKQGNGQPFFSTNQTYAQIIDTESNNLLMNMLRGYAFPSMYHQSNLYRYDGTNSLFTDTLQATINKFEAISSWPIISQSEAAIGQTLLNRMAYNASGVVARWTPKSGSGTGSIAIAVSAPAIIDMTGITCVASANVTCETYGKQTIAHINMTATPTTNVTSPL